VVRGAGFRGSRSLRVFFSYRWGALPQVPVGRPSGASQLDRGVEGPYRPRALWAVGPMGPLFFFLPFLLASIRTRERNSPNTCYLTTHLATSNDNARAQLAQHLLPEYSPDNIQRPRLAASAIQQ